MAAPRVKIVLLGQAPPDFDVSSLPQWKSRAFRISEEIETYQLNQDANGPDWEFMDEQFAACIPEDPASDFLLAFVNVKLEQNWYVRRLTGNRLVFTFYEMAEILRVHRLPLMNLALRVTYVALLIYKRFGNRIPPASEQTNYAHDETRGCVFDMNPSKSDVTHSLHEPRICERCVASLKNEGVSNETIEIVQEELRQIRKPLIDRIAGFIRAHTIWSIVLTLVSAIIIGTLTSLLSTAIYDFVRGSP